MKFVRFEIENFKGIERAVLDLFPQGAGVYTLIGLNESGKTTILEAIDEFGVAREGTEALYGAKRLSTSHASRFIPKHLEASFSGRVAITATVEFEGDELKETLKKFTSKTSVIIEDGSIKQRFSITRGYKFENSDLKSRIYEWDIDVVGKKKSAKKARVMDHRDDAWLILTDMIDALIPRIIYFPTFLFSIPEKIVLNPARATESDVNRHYRRIIQDVADSLTTPLDVKTHLVDRILNEATLAEQILSLWSLAPDKQKQINATLNAISAHLTRTVFDSWGKIFSGNFSGRELIVRLGIDNIDSSKQVYLQIVLKDGQQEYEVAERSLGFRWFFSFLLFTYYRVYAKGRGATLFLLDEPASNLHSRAQMQLLESFARIANGSSAIMYSTHSHYMINPEWLDQAFVVANSAIDYDEAIGSSENKPTAVVVDRYRRFVGENPDKTTYFQPVLDKLEVVPSRIDLIRPTVLVEGKGDFYILEYGRKVLLSSTSDVAVVPTRGAAGMDELVGLFLGWGIRFAICLDGDRAGVEARKRYINDWGMPTTRVFTLDMLDETLICPKIEGLLTEYDLALVAAELGLEGKPSKSQIQLFFSEALSRRKKFNFSKDFAARIVVFEAAVTAALACSLAASENTRKTKRLAAKARS